MAGLLTEPTRASLRLADYDFSYLTWEPAGRWNGRTLLLLHGLQGAAASMARTAQALAARGWRAVAPDLPGHGRTFALDGSDAERPGPLDLAMPTVLRLVMDRRYRFGTIGAAVGQLAARLGLDRPAVFAHSWGAMVAPYLIDGELLPERLVLLDPPFVSETQARARAAAYVAESEAMARSQDPGETAASSLLGERPDWDATDLAAGAEGLTQVSHRMMVGVVAANIPWDPVPGLVAFRKAHPEIPLLVIVGEPELGSMVPHEGRARLIHAVGPQSVRVMTGTGHSPVSTDFEAFLPIVLEGLADLT